MLSHRTTARGAVLLLTLAAAVFYPGGFDVQSQFFSELGATTARNGELNAMSSSLFLVANLVIALTLVPFWLEAPSLLGDTGWMRGVGRVGSILGLMSSPFMVGVALHPIDTHLEMHFRLFLVFFPLFNVASLLYSIVLTLHQGLDRKPGLLGLLLFALSMLVMLEPSASYIPLLQKAILYGYFFWVLMLSWHYQKTGGSRVPENHKWTE